MENANFSNFTNTNITKNSVGGVRFDAASTSGDLYSNYICFNGLDLNNLGTNNIGSLDRCDSFAGWSENGHLGCEYTCTSFWHRFFGNVDGSIILTDSVGANYVYNWSSTGIMVYFTDYDALISWGDLQAIGRNTADESSEDDFTELDIAFNSTGFSDNIETLYSVDGSLPIETDNYMIFKRDINDVPLASSTATSTSFKTGILWDMSDGGTEYSNTISQSTVWVVNVSSSTEDIYGTYDYLIQVPDTLASYESDTDLITIYVELQ
jgi:hypothetical protein